MAQMSPGSKGPGRGEGNPWGVAWRVHRSPRAKHLSGLHVMIEFSLPVQTLRATPGTPANQG